MSVHKRTTKSGIRYDVRLRDGNKRLTSKSFRSRKDANAWQAEQQVQRSRGAWVSPNASRITLQDWCEQWLASRPHVRPKTLEKDSGLLRNHVFPVLGHRSLNTLKAKDVQTLIDSLCTRLAPSSIGSTYSALRTALNAAVDAELCAKNPCIRVKLPPPTPRRDRHAFTREEIHRLHQALPPEYAAIVPLCIEVGLRYGEMAGLQVRHINLLKRTATIEQQIIEGKHSNSVGPLKTKSSHRTVAISDELVVTLAEHLSKSGLSAADNDSWVFPSPDDRPLRYSNFKNRVWKPALKAAGLPTTIGTHSLRYTFATLSLEQGIDIKTIQARGGWANPRVLMEVYAQVPENGDNRAAKTLGTLLSQTMDQEQDLNEMFDKCSMGRVD